MLFSCIIVGAKTAGNQSFFERTGRVAAGFGMMRAEKKDR
jgi:hypothetical protein